MPSFAPCLHEEADTRIFARVTEAAKMPNKKISSWVVVTFPFGILGQVWYLIVSIPDLCPFLTFILYA